MSQPDESTTPDLSQTPAAPDAADQLVLTSPEEARSPRDFVLWAGVIVLAVLVAYSPAIRGKFIWDDDRHVEQNKNLRDAQGLANIWTKFGASRGGTVQYYPVTHTSYWIEYQLFEKGDPQPLVFHVTHVLLHAAAA